MSLPKSAEPCYNQELKNMFKEAMSQALKLGIIDIWTYQQCDFYTIKSCSVWGKACKGINEISCYITPWVCINEVFIQNPSKAWETLTHEIAHLNRHSQGHGYIWKQNFYRLGSYFGVTHFERCSSSKDIGIEMPKRVKNNNYKYALQCTICGYTWKYKTNCQAIQHAASYRHNKCSTTKPLVAIKL